MQARLKKKANRHLEKLRHISEQQRNLQRQAMLSPGERAASRRSTVRGWWAWVRTVINGVRGSRLRDALWLLSPRGPRVHSRVVGSGKGGGADGETDAVMDALVRAPPCTCSGSPVCCRLSIPACLSSGLLCVRTGLDCICELGLAAVPGSGLGPAAGSIGGVGGTCGGPQGGVV